MNCPNCNQKLIRYNGNPSSQILLVIEEPSYKDIMNGLPLSDEIGELLRYELMRIGITIENCRLASLWLHRKDMQNNQCFLHGWDTLRKELMKSRKLTIFFGTEFFNLFNINPNYITLPVSGEKYFPSEWILVLSNLSTNAIYSGIGELRLALEKAKAKL